MKTNSDESLYYDHYEALSSARNTHELDEAIRAIDKSVFVMPRRFKPRLLVQIGKAFQERYKYIVKPDDLKLMLPTWYPVSQQEETA